MKLFTFPGAPNPLRVHLMMAEKSVELEVEVVDLTKQQQLTAEYRQKNPNCDVPMLVLDDGSYLSQVPAIMMYLERKYPHPSLYGNSDDAISRTIMWEHLMAMNGLSAVAEILRNSSSAMIDRALVGPHDYEQIPALAERGRKRVKDFFNDLNERLIESDFVAGEDFTVADITAWVSVNFAGWVKEYPGGELGALLAWYHKLAARPAFQAVLGGK